MQIARNEGRMIRENWYLLERAIYYQQNDYHGLEKTLKELVVFYPKTQYWLQLSAVYDELKQPKRSLSVLETAYDKGYLSKESELMSFASLLLQEQIPFKAAKVIDQGIKDQDIERNSKNLVLLADAWMLAREYDKAVEVLEASVEIADTGEQAYKLAQVYMEKNEWEKSGKLINKAIQQGKLKDEGNAWLIQGLSFFNQKQIDSALSAFNKAKNFEKQSKAAEQWLNYAQQEKLRQEYIESFVNS
jgi:tetratricopeptide (TPR) repeat protein